MISRFSALLSSAAFVKLKLPEIIVVSSIRMILLWAIRCLSSMKTGMPALATNVAEEYFSVSWLLSRTIPSSWGHRSRLRVVFLIGRSEVLHADSTALAQQHVYVIVTRWVFVAWDPPEIPLILPVVVLQVRAEHVRLLHASGKIPSCCPLRGVPVLVASREDHILM